MVPPRGRKGRPTSSTAGAGKKKEDGADQMPSSKLKQAKLQIGRVSSTSSVSSYDAKSQTSQSKSEGEPSKKDKTMRPMSSFAQPSAFRLPDQPPIARGGTRSKGKQKAEEDEKGFMEDVLWVDLSRPTNRSELALHPKKVEDVKRWLSEALDGPSSLRKYRRILALTGPAGSGKTAALRVLSSVDEVNFDITEWNNGSPAAGGNDFGGSYAASFADFLDRSTRYLPLSFDDVAPMSTPSSAGFNRRRVVLIEDLPNLQHPPTREAFQAAVKTFLTPSSSPVPVDRPPLVLILSETVPRTDEDAWGGSGAASWRDRENQTLDLRSVLPEDVRCSEGFTNIKFNPIATTILSKGLQRALSAGIENSTTAMKRPSKEAIDLIARSSNGDIRSAINCLHFLCSANLPDGLVEEAKMKKRTAKGVVKKDGKSKGQNAKAMKKLLDMMAQRESSLALFHALGKVLWNKRIGDDPEEQDDPSSSADELSDEKVVHLSADKGLEWVTKERQRRQHTQADTGPPALPSHLQEWERRQSRADAEELWRSAPVDTSTFQLFLHHNYPNFCTDIDECLSLMEYMSLCDAEMRPDVGMFQHLPVISQHAFAVSVRGTLVSLPSPVPRRGQRILKPAFWEMSKQARENMVALDDFQRLAYSASVAAGATTAWSREVLTTELVPSLRFLRPRSRGGLPEKIVELSTLKFERPSAVDTSRHVLGEDEIPAEDVSSSQPNASQAVNDGTNGDRSVFEIVSTDPLEGADSRALYLEDDDVEAFD